MTADQTLAAIDATLEAVSLCACGCGQRAVSSPFFAGEYCQLRWDRRRSRTATASGPGWVHPRSPELESTHPLPVTYQEIMRRDVVDVAAVEPVRALLEAPGERSHAARLAATSSKLGVRSTPVTRGEAAQPKGFRAVLRRLINIGRR